VAKGDQQLKQGGAQPTRDSASSATPEAQDQQGRYGSGGSYGVGGGFDDAEHRDSAPEEPDDRVARAARSEAQQDRQQVAGFEREVDPDAAPHKPLEGPHDAAQRELAAKNRRGSRI
jgi:hypothetical protein